MKEYNVMLIDKKEENTIHLGQIPVEIEADNIKLIIEIKNVLSGEIINYVEGISKAYCKDYIDECIRKTRKRHTLIKLLEKL